MMDSLTQTEQRRSTRESPTRTRLRTSDLLAFRTPTHLLRDDPDAVDARAFRRVDHADDRFVAERRRSRDEQRLVAALAINRVQTRTKLVDRDRLLIDRQPAIGGVVNDDLIRWRLRAGRLSLRRQLALERLL